MICMKKDYERNVKLINGQLQSCQHEHLSTVQTPLPTTLDHCGGYLSFLCICFVENGVDHV